MTAIQYFTDPSLLAVGDCGLNLSTPTLALLVALGVIATIALAAWRRASRPTAAEIDRENVVAFGAQCPNCSARLSEQRGGSFERRRCAVCGNKFELK
jgi:hypothetical protein